MSLNTNQLVDLFREESGESAATVLAATAISFINKAYRGARSVLPMLYPALSAELGAIADLWKFTLTADTTEYTPDFEYPVGTNTKLLKLAGVHLKYSSSGAYRDLRGNRVLRRPIHEYDPEAEQASSDAPAVGWHGGKLYIWPKPSQTVAEGIMVEGLLDPQAIAAGGDGLLVDDLLAPIVVIRGVGIWHWANRRYDAAKAANAEVTSLIAQALARSPDIQGPRELLPARDPGNLLRYE